MNKLFTYINNKNDKYISVTAPDSLTAFDILSREVGHKDLMYFAENGLVPSELEKMMDNQVFYTREQVENHFDIYKYIKV